MSYDIYFKVKVDGMDKWVPVGECDANITWNVGDMIRKSTGLEWKNEENNGLCVDVIPKIVDGLKELIMKPDKYNKYEDIDGWGTITGTIDFFITVIRDWRRFYTCYPNLAPIATFWIE